MHYENIIFSQLKMLCIQLKYLKQILPRLTQFYSRYFVQNKIYFEGDENKFGNYEFEFSQFIDQLRVLKLLFSHLYLPDKTEGRSKT